jgi:ACS family glucarate transporter-like MFS transporter
MRLAYKIADETASAERGYFPKTSSAYRWVVLFVVWFGFLLSFVDRLLWTNVATVASSSLGLPIAALGAFVTAFYIGYVFSTALTGLASDRIGPRLMLTIALVPLGAFTFLFGNTKSLPISLSLQALMGLTAGADFSAGVKLIISWFQPTERGRAMGIFTTATSLGVVLTNTIVPRALEYLSWIDIYHVAGLLTSIFGIVCYALVRDNPTSSVSEKTEWVEVRRALATRQYIWVVLAGFGGVWGTLGFAIWANALMINALKISAVTAGGIVASFALAAIISKPAIGLLSDWLGGRRKMLAMLDLLVFAALLMLTGTLRSETQMWIMAPVLGFFAFGFTPLTNAIAAEAGGKAAGTAAGVYSSVGSIGTSIVPLIVGAAFQATQSYQIAFAVLAMGPLLASLCMIPVRDTKSS